MKYNKEIDAENIKIFKRYGVTEPSEFRHRCVLCEKKISIDNSYSTLGEKMICVTCAIDEFNADYIEAFNWMNGVE